MGATTDRGGTTLERLYVCPHCFKYTTELVPYRGHVEMCGYRDVTETLGGLVYEKENLSVCEVDGEEYKVRIGRESYKATKQGC